MSPATYKFAYIPTPDGRFKLAVEVFGPLPDPLAGLDTASRCQTPSGTAPFASLRTAPTLGFHVLG